VSAQPVAASTLPDVLLIEHMAALLGTSTRSVRRAMKRRDWPFAELPSIDRKLRWSRDQVVALLSTGSAARSRRIARVS
jgi:hypothetical protein